MAQPWYERQPAAELRGLLLPHGGGVSSYGLLNSPFPWQRHGQSVYGPPICIEAAPLSVTVSGNTCPLGAYNGREARG